MRIRLGYVAIALNLDKVTSSSTLTYSRYLKMDEENRLKKLKEVTYSNIEALEKILGYNLADFFERNTLIFKTEINEVLETLLNPNEND